MQSMKTWIHTCKVTSQIIRFRRIMCNFKIMLHKLKRTQRIDWRWVWCLRWHGRRVLGRWRELRLIQSMASNMFMGHGMCRRQANLQIDSSIRERVWGMWAMCHPTAIEVILSPTTQTRLARLLPSSKARCKGRCLSLDRARVRLAPTGTPPSHQIWNHPKAKGSSFSITISLLTKTKPFSQKNRAPATPPPWGATSEATQRSQRDDRHMCIKEVAAPREAETHITQVKKQKIQIKTRPNILQVNNQGWFNLRNSFHRNNSNFNNKRLKPMKTSIQTLVRNYSKQLKRKWYWQWKTWSWVKQKVHLLVEWRLHNLPQKAWRILFLTKVPTSWRTLTMITNIILQQKKRKRKRTKEMKFW